MIQLCRHDRTLTQGCRDCLGENDWRVVSTRHDYSEGPFVAIRVHDEAYNWAIDAVDIDGGYSEACMRGWDDTPFATREAAAAHTADFARDQGLSTALPVIFIESKGANQ